MYTKIRNLVILILAVGTVHAQPVEKGVPHTLALQRHADISHLSYQLSFNIPKEKDAEVTGTATISFVLRQTISPLQLDFRQDSSHVLSVIVNGHPAISDVRNEHIVIDRQLLQKGKNSVTVVFISGNESLNRNNDYLYTLFVPDRARTVFPCFDQPDLKAVFSLALTVPAGWTVLANAPIKDSVIGIGYNLYHFKTSDKLPTYLFSFTAGKYAVASKYGMRFLYRETDSAKIRLSVDSIFGAHKNAIAFLEEWTGIPFPFQKVGFVALPAFQFGGMEHPGAVQYNAPALFLDEGATREQQIARAALVSHETAHMWFGDLVTMQWFNDVWMKEVFANFMADKVTEKLLGHDIFQLKFLLDHTPAAYSIDRTPGANAIRQQLDNLKDAGSMYGSIIYHKAPIMMRQLELLMGKDAFRAGVQEYLRRYRYGNANWDDLIAILAKHTSADLVSWNKVWVNRPGRPVFDYEYNNKQLIISQSPEFGTGAVWPQQYNALLLYADSIKTIHINMTGAKFILPLPHQPTAVLLNSDGMGYGVFPAVFNDRLNYLQDPLVRSTACINAYEDMLAKKTVSPGTMLTYLMQSVQKEKNELNLRMICGYIGNVYWNFITPEIRNAQSDTLEQVLWTTMKNNLNINNKKILFKAYQDIYMSAAAGKLLYDTWQTQKAPDSIKLTEDDYTSLALTIALKTDTANTILQQQVQRVSNPDRKARLQFLLPALSPDSIVRNQFFKGLSDINNRRKESWVATALSYINHPLRQKSFTGSLPTALNMLEDIQRTGDIFFPQNWLNAIFSNYQSEEAWQAVDHFLTTHPGYNPMLRAKILQATDNLHRARSL